MTEKSKARPVIGLSDSETVKLDFDDASFSFVRYWTLRAMKWFRLKGFVILKSSENCYHVVFDRVVSWSENMRIVAWVALQSHNKGLLMWFLMQCIKGCSTLRLSSKREKSPPRVVCKFGKQSKSVKDFIKTRKIVKKVERKLRKTHDF